MTYNYSDKNDPSLKGIHTDVGTSAMTDKLIDYCRWDEDSGDLKVVFAGTLSAGDKTILDGIVADNS